MTPRERLPLSEAQISAFCQKHHIVRLAVFGSLLRDNVSPSSDVDLLVEFERQHLPGLQSLAATERDLSAMMGGWCVDMRTRNDLRRYLRDDVMAQAVMLYVDE